MNFDELTINDNNKDQTRFSETPRLSTTSSVNHSSSCSVNQPVSNQDLQTIIGSYPFEAQSGFHWVLTWYLFPLHQKAAQFNRRRLMCLVVTRLQIKVLNNVS